MNEPEDLLPIDDAGMTAPLSAYRQWLGRGQLVIRLRGEIDIATEGALGDELLGAANRSDVRLLVCDLSDVEFMACAGLTVLLEVLSILHLRHARLRVVATRRIILRVFDGTGLAKRLGVRRTLAEALAHDLHQEGMYGMVNHRGEA